MTYFKKNYLREKWESRKNNCRVYRAKLSDTNSLLNAVYYVQHRGMYKVNMLSLLSYKIFLFSDPRLNTILKDEGAAINSSKR